MLVREVPTSRRKSDISWAIGLTVALALLVIIAPTMDSGPRCRKSEEALRLNKLGKRAKSYFIETGAFPIGWTQAMPPWSCCPDACGVLPRQAWLADPMWAALDFSIDEVTQIRFSYESVDGQTFRATAVRDVNCSGVHTTYVLEGSSKDGNPSVQLFEPAP